MRSRHKLIAAQILCVAASVAAAGIEYSRDPETGLDTWLWQDKSGSFTFNQLLPNQSRAYFQGRGFRPGDADAVAVACVFQAIVRAGADAPGPLEIDLAQWRVTPSGGGSHPPRLEADRQREWERREAAQAARIAFRWSLFPTRQTFQPGDWNMGMVTFGPPPGEHFRLEVTWLQEGESRQVSFDQMRCAADRH